MCAKIPVRRLEKIKTTTISCIFFLALERSSERSLGSPRKAHEMRTLRKDVLEPDLLPPEIPDLLGLGLTCLAAALSSWEQV